MGYKLINPQGAFYLLVKAPDGNGNKFSEFAKKYDIIMPSGETFGAPEYVRISYCVSKQVIINSIPSFAKLIKEYQNA